MANNVESAEMPKTVLHGVLHNNDNEGGEAVGNGKGAN
jgi:hypothetical protein